MPAKPEPRCCYKVLGIDRSASIEEIRKAYLKQAVKWHPDRNLDKSAEATEAFKEISAAYEILSDSDKRAAYDRYGSSGNPVKSAPADFSAARRRPSGQNRHSSSSVFNDPFSFSPFAAQFGFSFHRPEDVFRQFHAEHSAMMEAIVASLLSSMFSTQQQYNTTATQKVNNNNLRRAASTASSATSTHSTRTVPVRQQQQRPRVVRSSPPSAGTVGGSTNPAGLNRQTSTTNIPVQTSSQNPPIRRRRYTTNIYLPTTSHTAAADGAVPTQQQHLVPPQRNRVVRATSTRFVGGNTVTTRNTIRDGIETLEVEKNGVLTHRTVNGKMIAVQSSS